MSILEVILQLFLTIILGIIVITPIIWFFSWVHKIIIKRKIPVHLINNKKEVKNGFFKEKESRKLNTRAEDSRGNENTGERELADLIKRRITAEAFGGADKPSESSKLQHSSPKPSSRDNKTIKIHRPVDL